MAIVLTVDDEPRIRDLMSDCLRLNGHEVHVASSAEEARDLLDHVPAQVVLTDLGMPGEGGLGLLRWLASHRPDAVRIVVSGRAEPDQRLSCEAAGAHAFIPKPFSIRDIAHAVRDALLGCVGLSSEKRDDGPVVESEAMRRTVALARRVASSPTTVLLSGSSGVGKEVVARLIHDSSARRDGPFVAVHCGALSPSLLESELFGHVRGAFTGATADRRGCFEAADGGTLVLDEIGTMSADVQVRLLRVLQEREVTRVGDATSRRVDVRIVAATNACLERLVAAGRFREDLYFRLNVFHVPIPPLVDRRADVLPLARRFVRELAADRRVTISPEAEKALLAHPWPGNVRELHNVIERALVMLGTGDGLRREHLELDDAASTTGLDQNGLITLPPEGLSLPELMSRIERDLILQSLARVGGSRSEAARLLGLKRTTLVQKLKRSHVERATA